MNRVYILGAGASHDLEFSLEILSDPQTFHYVFKDFSLQGPLSNGFFFYVNEFAKKLSQSPHFSWAIEITDPWLVKFIGSNYQITINELFHDRKKSNDVNIENLYTKVEQKLEDVEKEFGQGSNEYNEVFAGSFCLIKFIFESLSMISFNCESLHHQTLAHWISKTGGDIISFNWDTLIDDALYELETCWNYSDGYGGIKPAKILKNNFDLPADIDRKEGASKHLVLKPHGSINWYADQSNLRASEVEMYISVSHTRRGFWQRGVSIQRQPPQIMKPLNGRYLTSLIIPPGRKREQFQNLWEIVTARMEEADEINIIGFSLNNFDGHIEKKFRNIKLKSDVLIKVIDPDESLVDKYKRLFAVKNVQKPFGSFRDYCEWIKKQPGMENHSEVVEKTKIPWVDQLLNRKKQKK
jgi:hypothetical protein